LPIPVHGGEDLGHPDAAVVIGVDERQGLLVERRAPRRARQRDPQLLIQLVEVREVRAGREDDLIDAARAEEAPAVGCSLRHGGAG
jgi:hypothetical protein